NPAVTAAFNVIVTAPNLPSINAIADQSMTVGDTLDVAYTVVDSIGNVITGSVTTEALSDNDGIAAAVVTAPGTIQLTANGVGQVNITVLANDGVNPSASTQFLVNVTPAAAAPTVEQVGDQFLNAGAVLDVPYNVLDSSSNSITASVSANAVSNNDAVVSAVVTAPGVIQLTGNSGGTAIVTLTVSDGVTNPVDMAFNITVNSPPTIDPIGDQSLTSGEEITVALTLADPDPGEILTLTAISRNEGVASASAVNNNAVVLRGVSEGQTIIDLTVDDARGGVTQLSFTVNVSSAAPSFDLMAYPVLPDITPQMAQTLGLVYQGGLGLGNRANAFAKVGDDAMDSANFMAPFAAPGYNLGDFGQLQGMIDTYAATTVHGDTANSFNVDSVAAGPSFGIDTLSASAPAGPPCDAVGASTILGCELQATAPSIALISFSAANVTYMDPSQFRGELQALVTESMSTYGVIPVLATIPTGSDDQLPDYNQIIVEVATQSGVPLWNLWRAMHERGIGDPNGVAPGGAGDLTDAALGFGYNMRNLTALQALQVVRQAAGIQ
ncbi:MAG: SGNH/GDSL hydrolase family protein, partial [Anaerolineae bacterium]|nr:SGNH/GDSL hydrolase family protein [Anaerolineae bacterium]